MVGVPFQLQYGIILEGANGTNVTSTAKLSLSLPPGYSIVSTGGYSQPAMPLPEQPAIITPEPSTLGLAIFALLYYIATQTCRQVGWRSMTARAVPRRIGT
jgi:hypothetical protein